VVSWQRTSTQNWHFKSLWSLLVISSSITLYSSVLICTHNWLLWTALHLFQFAFPLLRSKSKSKLCYDRRSVGQSVLVSSTHLGLKNTFLFLSDSCGFVDVGRPLWREDGSAVHNCCWPPPAQWFSGPSPAGLMIFYCLRFETPPTWRTRSLYLYTPGKGWPSYTPRHWVPFS
jgi:hypothetical protein